MNLLHSGRAGGGFSRRPPARRPRMLIDIIPFVLSYVTTTSGGDASPGLGGQCTPKGKGKDMGKNTKTHYMCLLFTTCFVFVFQQC